MQNKVIFFALTKCIKRQNHSGNVAHSSFRNIFEIKDRIEKFAIPSSKNTRKQYSNPVICLRTNTSDSMVHICRILITFFAEEMNCFQRIHHFFSKFQQFFLFSPFPLPIDIKSFGLFTLIFKLKSETAYAKVNHQTAITQV